MAYNKETGMYEGYIYKITNKVNGKIYIGQTRRTIRERWSNHKTCVNTGKPVNHMYSSMNKYGIENFKIEEIDKTESSKKKDLINNLNKLEIYYIKLFNSTDKDVGYNISDGGNSTNYKEKRVDQYNIDGSFVKTWNSFVEIRENTEFSSAAIISVCRGKTSKSYGFVWRYHGDSFHKYDFVNKRSIKQYSLDGILIREYKSIAEAAKINDYNVSAINLCCLGRLITSAGFIWRYKDDDFNKYKITRYAKTS